MPSDVSNIDFSVRNVLHEIRFECDIRNNFTVALILGEQFLHVTSVTVIYLFTDIYYSYLNLIICVSKLRIGLISNGEYICK